MNSLASTLSDEHIVVFFRKLKNELNCSSTGRVIAQVRQILSKVKNFSAPGIAAKTPPLLHLVMASNPAYGYDHETRRIDHLDELADSLYHEDKQSGRGLFKSELEALKIAIVILTRLQDLFRSVDVQAFPYTLSNELQQAAIEEAA